MLSCNKTTQILPLPVLVLRRHANILSMLLITAFYGADFVLKRLQEMREGFVLSSCIESYTSRFINFSSGMYHSLVERYLWGASIFVATICFGMWAGLIEKLLTSVISGQPGRASTILGVASVLAQFFCIKQE